MLSNAALCATRRSGASVRTIVSFPTQVAGIHTALLRRPKVFRAKESGAARHWGRKYNSCRAMSWAADSNFYEDR